MERRQAGITDDSMLSDTLVCACVWNVSVPHLLTHRYARATLHPAPHCDPLADPYLFYSTRSLGCVNSRWGWVQQTQQNLYTYILLSMPKNVNNGGWVVRFSVLANDCG